jgi:hypothetical protein
MEAVFRLRAVPLVRRPDTRYLMRVFVIKLRWDCPNKE